MYLAKFFHRAPGDQDKELLFIPGGTPIVIGIHMHGDRCVLIHLEPGDRFGWCFHWDHDGAWELEQPTSSFDAALKALTSGIEQRTTDMLGFLGVYLD